ncbi:MAG: adenylate/guanylate cyclase domain-containing protein [Alphaproteobacteria bacterium]|nr:adenylate/guanylate cyclase domain-containing protein [Alphaproteobacteria bacterium]
MALIDDLKAETARIFRDQWNVREGRVVPSPEDVKLSNDAVHFDRATVLYADLSGSTKMVDTKKWYFSAEIYRTFLYCAARIVKYEGGEITSYDGDRIMGVFIGDNQTTSAARCGLKINYAAKHIINPAILKQYTSSTFKVRHVVGIDTSEVHVARTGARGGNDLVWIGRAPNYAAKMTSLDPDYPTWVTGNAYYFLADEAKYGGKDKSHMWEQRSWTDMSGMTIYRSSWTWTI